MTTDMDTPGLPERIKRLDVTLSGAPPVGWWRDFMALRDQLDGAPGDFLADRAQNVETRDPLTDWAD